MSVVIVNVCLSPSAFVYPASARWNIASASASLSYVCSDPSACSFPANARLNIASAASSLPWLPKRVPRLLTTSSHSLEHLFGLCEPIVAVVDIGQVVDYVECESRSLEHPFCFRQPALVAVNNADVVDYTNTRSYISFASTYRS
ncbi:hypothetical protein KCU89_g110, partial [Aureobasidium melanogenum]